jgi:hypothetical protein
MSQQPPFYRRDQSKQCMPWTPPPFCAPVRSASLRCDSTRCDSTRLEALRTERVPSTAWGFFLSISSIDPKSSEFGETTCRSYSVSLSCEMSLGPRLPMSPSRCDLDHLQDVISCCSNSVMHCAPLHSPFRSGVTRSSVCNH